MDGIRNRLLSRLKACLAPAASTLLVCPGLFANDGFPFPPSPAPRPYYAAEEGRVRLAGDAEFQVPIGPEYSNADLAPVFAPAPICLPPQASPNRPQMLQAPNMVGDALGFFGTVDVTATNLTLNETLDARLDIPVSGRVPKVAENNSPVPRDRVYFAYNHFRGAYDTASTVTPPPPVNPDDPILSPQTRTRLLDQNRFTLGIEKTFFFDDMSVELRVPLVNQVNFNAPSVTDPTLEAFSGATNDPTGNVALNFKQVLLDWYSEATSGVLSWGMGMAFPTSEGATIEIYDSPIHIKDQALHFSPYLAFLVTKDNGLFLQGFFQFDFTTDEVKVRDRINGVGDGYRPPNNAYIDLGIGYWLYNNPSRTFLIGMAPLLEFHYSGQMRDLESPTLSSADATLIRTMTFNTQDGKRNVYNVTAGMHTSVTKWMNVRTAGVFPFKSDPNREFDAEFVFQMDLTR